MAEPNITVEVVYARPDNVIRQSVSLAAGSTVEQAIALSGIERKLVPDSIDPERLGIHGRKVVLDQRLTDGDRVEIYRALVFDPMQARRRRARR